MTQKSQKSEPNLQNGAIFVFKFFVYSSSNDSHEHILQESPKFLYQVGTTAAIMNTVEKFILFMHL